MKFFSAHDGPHVHNGEVETNFAIIDSVILQQTERIPVMKEKLMHIEMHLFSSAQKKNNQGGIRPRARINYYASTPQLFGARKVRIERHTESTKNPKPQPKR
jgi:hypothetical protein